MSASTLDPRVSRVFEAFDDHDADRAIDQFSPAGTYYEVPRDEALSPDEFRAYLADELFVTFPDYAVDVRRVLTTADWATTVEWSFTGTHEGAAGWFEPTGQTVTQRVVSVVTLADDGITSWYDFFDGQALAEQLGQ